MKIYLIGFMGVGKTTISQELANITGAVEYDTDALIVDREGKSIPRIFEEKGQDYFRSLETEILRQVSQGEDAIVSCGGGIILKQENINIMKESGSVVWLDASPATILEHVKDDNNRPLLKGKKNIEDIGKMMAERQPKYENAADFHISTDGLTKREIAEKIIKCLK